jgi:hypothetical protein
MLAAFLSEPRDHSAYPDDTWSYLNGASTGAPSGSSIREHLLAERRNAGRVPLDSNKSGVKIALLTGTDASDKKLNMDLLSERAAMLSDVRDEVSAMKRDLAQILREIRAR